MRRTKREELIRAFLINEGFEPNERQLAWAVAFCTPGRCFRDSIKAARVAGYPNPEEGGDFCYGEMGDILQKFLHEQDTMSLAVWQTVSEQLQAVTTKVISHQGVVLDMVSMADNGARIAAAKLAAEMLGMKAPEKSEITIHDPAERLKRAEERLRGAE